MLKHSLTIVLVLVLATGCKESNTTKNDQQQDKTIDREEVSEEVSANGEQQKPRGYWQKLVLKELRDKNGTVLATTPVPASWVYHDNHAQGEPSITGPHGLKITDFPLQGFMDNYNPSIQAAYRGRQLRTMPGIENLIQQDFVPYMNNKGYQLVRSYEIPEVSKMDRWYTEQLFAAMPARLDVAAIGTEWKTEDGSPYFLLIHLNVKTSEAMQNWFYMCNGLEAEPEYFETAKNQLVFALSNMRYNLQPIMVYNEQEAQRVGQSWAAHNRRMAQNQAAFEANQRAHINRTNAVNDAIMSGWRANNATSDRMQEQTIDGIYERTNVVDPTTGQGYKVDAGANQYWMNNDGQYIGTNLQGYNPNLDDNMNERKWQELQEVKR